MRKVVIYLNEKKISDVFNAVVHKPVCVDCSFRNNECCENFSGPVKDIIKVVTGVSKGVIGHEPSDLDRIRKESRVVLC